jgi:two-component sensor histidine kinase
MRGESVGAAGGPVESSGYLAHGTWHGRVERHARVELPNDDSAPYAARRAAEKHLGDALDGDATATVDLLVTELVSNAVRHGRARSGGTLDMHLGVGARCVRVEVYDGGRGFALDRPAPYGEGGYGLFLVDEVASRWGVGRADGTCVWFELDRREES